MLLFFRNLQTGDPWPLLVEHTVLLGERRRGVAERVVVAIVGGILLTLAGAIGWLWLQASRPGAAQRRPP